MVRASICGSRALAGEASGSTLNGPVGTDAAACVKMMRGEAATAAIPVTAIMSWRRDMEVIMGSPLKGRLKAKACVLSSVVAGDGNKWGSDVDRRAATAANIQQNA